MRTFVGDAIKGNYGLRSNKYKKKVAIAVRLGQNIQPQREESRIEKGRQSPSPLQPPPTSHICQPLPQSTTKYYLGLVDFWKTFAKIFTRKQTSGQAAIDDSAVYEAWMLALRQNIFLAQRRR